MTHTETLKSQYLMSDDSDYYNEDYESEPRDEVDTGVQKLKEKPKKPTSELKLEALRKAREAKKKKRMEKLNRPSTPQPVSDYGAETKSDVETVYVKRKTNRTKPKLIKPKKKQIVYVEESSESESDESEPEIRYVKRKPRKSKNRDPEPMHQPEPEYSHHEPNPYYHLNGDVVW